MAAVILPINLVLTATKTVIVIDSILWPGGGVVARAAQTIRSQTSQAPARSTAVASPRQQNRGPTSAGASTTVRSLHLRLVSMHAMSTLCHSAGAAKYLLPVSDTSCIVSHRIMLGALLLFDASVVTFLLAKVRVTNGHRVLAWWEKGVLWWSRLYGWLYLPMVALSLGTSFDGRAAGEGTFCYNGVVEEEFSKVTTSSNARGFGLNNALLVVQFILLLGLFVKPMLVHVQGTQSGGAIYRRVVLRNVFCTAGIVASYAISTVVVVLALLRESVESNMAAQIRDVTLALNSLGTLCITEIALPLGFLSCMKACSVGNTTGDTTKSEIEGNAMTKAGTADAGNTTATKTKVVPFEELPPEPPIAP